MNKRYWLRPPSVWLYRLKRCWSIEQSAVWCVDFLRGEPMGMIWRLQVGPLVLTRWHRFTWPRG